MNLQTICTAVIPDALPEATVQTTHCKVFTTKPTSKPTRENKPHLLSQNGHNTKTAQSCMWQSVGGWHFPWNKWKVLVLRKKIDLNKTPAFQDLFPRKMSILDTEERQISTLEVLRTAPLMLARWGGIPGSESKTTASTPQLRYYKPYLFCQAKKWTEIKFLDTDGYAGIQEPNNPFLASLERWNSAVLLFLLNYKTWPCCIGNSQLLIASKEK